MLKLHYAPGTIAVAPALALAETGTAFTPVRVDFAAAEQTKPDYHEINPKGRVPALETPDGILTETGALLDYIAALAPDAGLVPTDLLAAARMRELMYYLASTMHVNHAHGMRGTRWADNPDSHADMAAKVPETMAASCTYVETLLERSTGPYLLGNTPNLADIYLYTICTWLPSDNVDIAAYPRLAAHFAAFGARPSVAATKALGILA